MGSESHVSAAQTPLTGWGANLRVACELAEPETLAEVQSRLKARRLIARGLGRSYGDPALNAGGLVLGMRKLDRYLAFDAASCSLTCEAGVTLEQIIADFAPRGFFPMITPGTKFVTIGGCIANDIHGKAHHAQGSFSSCVDAMRVLLASGDVVTCSREELPDLFWGSFGGMGLLGIVLSATLRLRAIETTYFKTWKRLVPDLSGMFDTLAECDALAPYSVASLDSQAVGKRLGRGVVNWSDHAKLSELPSDLARDPLRVAGKPFLRFPFELPDIAMNPLTIKLGNAYVMFRQSHTKPVEHYENVFYPLDSFLDWNRMYGSRGFTQYQFVVPFEDGLRNMQELLRAIVSSGELPFLNILKRFGKASEGVLSFPKAGYTFAIDFPIRRNTIALTRKLDAMVLGMGGRVYLGKDSYVEAPMFRAMYPRVDEFLEIKAKYDPENVFVSDLGRRVGLVPATAS